MATREEGAALESLGLSTTQNPVVVELGAHLGLEEFWIRGLFNERVTYIMLEPDPFNVQALLKKGTDSHRIVFQFAIADKTELREFHASINNEGERGSGSILKPTGHLATFPQITFPEKLKTGVMCITLDTLFERMNLKKIDLLWVDVQGAEAQMIRGGQGALSHTRYLFIEAEDQEFYEGQTLRPELFKMLEGWTRIGDFDYNFLFRNDNFTERL